MQGRILLRAGVYEASKRRLHRAEGPVALTPLEGRLLGYLAARAGVAVPMDEILREVWGYTSGVKTRTVYVTVDRLRQKIEVDPTKPDHIRSLPSVGYRFDELVAHGTSEAGTSLRAPPLLVGRAGVVNDVRQALAPGRAVTLTGPPGVGKTAVAATVAQLSPARLLCDLRSAHDEALATALLGMALGVGGAAAPEEGVTTALRAHGALLVVLDNVEDLPAAGALVDRWAAAAPEVAWLLTSRRPTRAACEVPFVVEPLDAEEAADLFEALAARLGEVTLRRREVLELVAALDGLPLAVELAAARLTAQTPSELLARLRDHSPRALAAPLSSEVILEASVGWSWTRLPPEAQAALAALAVFEGPFTLKAAAFVSPPGPSGEELVEFLAERSLLQVDRRQDPWRFRVLQCIRSYARANAPDGALARASEAHVRWCARWGSPAMLAAWEGPDAAAQLALGLAEVPDLLVVAGSATGETLVETALGLGRLLSFRGPFPPVLAALDRAAGVTGSSRLPEVLLLRGRIRGAVGRYAEAIEDLDLADAAFAARGDRPSRGRVHAQRAWVERAQGKLQTAIVTAQEAITLCAPSDDFAALAMAWEMIGSCQTYASLLPAATVSFEHALRFARKAGDRRREGTILGGLASALTMVGNLEAAEATHHAALAIHREFASDLSEAVELTNLGGCQNRRGRLDEAHRSLTRALAIQRRLGNARSVAVIQNNLASVAFRQGDLRAALLGAEEALAGHLAVGNRRSAGVVLENLGLQLHALGRTEEGEAQSRRALAINASIPSPRDEIVACTSLVDNLLARGATAEARALLDEHADRFVKNALAHDVYGYFGVASARVAEAEGDLDRMARDLDALVEHEQPDEQWCVSAWLERTRLALHRGEIGAARSALDHAAELYEAGGLAVPLQVNLWTVRAAVGCGEGDRPGARATLRDATRLADRAELFDPRLRRELAALQRKLR